MKVLMINVVCGIRSTGRICTDLATALEARGHDVKIAYGREEVPEQFQKYAVRIGTDIDVKLHALKARIYDACGFGSKRATEQLIEWVKEWDPDVIHLHNIHGYYINIEVLFKYLRSLNGTKKIIWTLHDCWAYTGHSAYCDTINCRRWLSGCHDCPNAREYPASYVDRSKPNWLKKKELMEGIPNLTIVTPSEWLKRNVAQSYLSEYPIQMIHNGINTGKFCYQKSDFRKQHEIHEKCLLLGVATSWDHMKGLEDFYQLSERLDDRFRIILVGVTKEQKKKLPTQIIGIERTNSLMELVQIYSACDLLLNLSYCENYPTVNLEAMACGTPVLTYDTGGSAESVRPNGGIVISKGDIEGVFQALQQFVQRTNEKKGHYDVIDLQDTIKQYQELYG